jgi:hypothetical protein
MAKRKSFPLRINEELLKAVQGWAVDDLRSVNAQLEFIIREALWKSGRLKKPKHNNSDNVTKPG